MTDQCHRPLHNFNYSHISVYSQLIERNMTGTLPSDKLPISDLQTRVFGGQITRVYVMIVMTD